MSRIPIAILALLVLTVGRPLAADESRPLDAIAPGSFDMEIGRVRSWPARDVHDQVLVGNDVESGNDTFDLWSVYAPNARADADLEGAEITLSLTLTLSLSDDTHSVIGSKAHVTAPDLDRFGSRRFGVSRRAERAGGSGDGLFIAGELTRLRYIRSRSIAGSSGAAASRHRGARVG